jgi:hypothetical protein
MIDLFLKDKFGLRELEDHMRRDDKYIQNFNHKS